MQKVFGAFYSADTYTSQNSENGQFKPLSDEEIEIIKKPYLNLSLFQQEKFKQLNALEEQKYAVEHDFKAKAKPLHKSFFGSGY